MRDPSSRQCYSNPVVGFRHTFPRRNGDNQKVFASSARQTFEKWIVRNEVVGRDQQVLGEWSAFGDYQSHIVVLLVRAELPNFIHNCSKHEPWRQFTMSPQRFDQVLFSKFLSGFIERVGDPDRIER